MKADLCSVLVAIIVTRVPVKCRAQLLKSIRQIHTDLPIHHTLQQLWTLCRPNCQANSQAREDRQMDRKAVEASRHVIR